MLVGQLGFRPRQSLQLTDGVRQLQFQRGKPSGFIVAAAV